MNKKDVIAVLGVLVLLVVVFMFITGQSGTNAGTEAFRKDVEERFGEGTWYNTTDGGTLFIPKNVSSLVEKFNKTEDEVCRMTEGMWVNGTCICPQGFINHPVYPYECMAGQLRTEVTPW